MRLAKQIELIGKILQEIGSDLYVRAFRNKGLAALTIGQFRYLEIVAARPGITATELAEVFGVKKPTVTQVTRVLVSRGLVGKMAAPEDGRKNRLFVTNTTRSIMAYRSGLYRVFADRVVRILSERQLRAYEALNDLVLKHYPRSGLSSAAQRSKG